MDEHHAGEQDDRDTSAERWRRLVDRIAALDADGALSGADRQQVDTLLGAIERRFGIVPSSFDRLAADGNAGSHPIPPSAPAEGLEESLAQLATLVARSQPTPTDGDDETTSLRLPSPTDATHLTMPADTPFFATVEGIYAGGPTPRWVTGDDGKPQYHYADTARNAQVTLHFERPPQHGDAVAALWEAVRQLNTQTVDILVLLVAKLAELPNPRKDTAHVRLEEVAEARGVRKRDGLVRVLYDDFKRDIQLLGDLRLSMTWTNPNDADEALKVAVERPAPLFDIHDISYTKSGMTWRAFNLRCGSGLAYFLQPDEIRALARYAKALLRLNPHEQWLEKRLGTYYSFAGAAATHSRQPLRVTPRALIAFAGMHVPGKDVGRVVDRLVEAHAKLDELGMFARPPDFEVVDRRKGYFLDWLDRPVELALASPLLADGPAPALTLGHGGPPGPPAPPSDAVALQADPVALRRFRLFYNLSTAEVGRYLGVSAMSVSRYERGRRLPDAVAERWLALWRTKVEQSA